MSTNFGSNRAKRAESAWRDRDDVANRNQRETGNSHQQKRLKKKKIHNMGKQFLKMLRIFQEFWTYYMQIGQGIELFYLGVNENIT